MLSALLASACCWLPLLLLTFGLSAVGVSAAFEKARPFFLVVCAVLLAGGFYFVYFRKRACASGANCAEPSPKLKRFNEVMLWGATLGVVAFAFFPRYARFLLAESSSTASSVNAVGDESVNVLIEGMTCEACATHAQKALGRVEGVKSVSVDYAEKRATVRFDAASPPGNDALVRAVEGLGYRASVVVGER